MPAYWCKLSIFTQMYFVLRIQYTLLIVFHHYFFRLNMRPRFQKMWLLILLFWQLEQQTWTRVSMQKFSTLCLALELKSFTWMQILVFLYKLLSHLLLHYCLKAWIHYMIFALVCTGWVNTSCIKSEHVCRFCAVGIDRFHKNSSSFFFCLRLMPSSLMISNMFDILSFVS